MTIPAQTTAKRAPRKAATKRAPAKKTAVPVEAAPPPPPPAGWYPNDLDGSERYWDGAAWTDQVRSAADELEEPAEATTPAPRLPVDPDLEDDPNDVSTAVIEFRGRLMKVRRPNEGQAGVMLLTARALRGRREVTSDEAEVLLPRLIAVVGGVLIHRYDREWMNDQLSYQDLTLLDMMEIMTLTNAAIEAKLAGAESTGPTPKPTRPKARRR